MIFKVKHFCLMGVGFLTLGSALTGCGSRAETAATPADPVALVEAISTGIQVAGAGMAAVTLNSVNETKGIRPLIASSDCDVHGYPNVNQANDDYPGHLTYCFMTVDSGDTVVGGFGTPQMVSCIAKEAGVTYDGVARTVTTTEAINTACGLTTDEVPLGTAVSITGSAPASFNANYANGIIIDMSDTIGLVFKMGTNTVGTKVSFITSESWTDLSIGTTAGSLDTSTGDLWYESRVERNDCLTVSRCGWNRHTRIHASLVMTGTTPTGLTSLSFGYSNIQFEPGQNSLGGIMVTAKGDLTDGIKARLWNATDGSSGAVTAATQYDTVANWVEDTNAACYTSSSDTASTCGTGLAAFSTNTKFALNSTDSHLAVADWFGAITGQTFTDVDMDEDTQY